MFQHGGMATQPDSDVFPAPAPVLAADVCRGVTRMLARAGTWCLAEMPLKGGRRADLMGVDEKGRLTIVEVKVSRADLMGDGKWTDYLDHCDRFYWALPPRLDCSPLAGEAFRPEECGVIVADGYDAEIVRPAPLMPLAAARRRAETERLARAALRRLAVSEDELCAPWADRALV